MPLKSKIITRYVAAKINEDAVWAKGFIWGMIVMFLGIGGGILLAILAGRYL